MDYIVYYFKHERKGYEHNEYLCFPCATNQATNIKSGETIHPVITREGGPKKCPCGTKLNWIDS